MLFSRNLQMLMHYTRWANAKLYESLAPLPPEVISAPRAGRAAGLIGTLSHYYVVDLIWKAHLEGSSHGFTTRNLDQAMPLAELRAAQAAVDGWYCDYADASSDAGLAEIIDFKFVDGGAGSLSRGEMLLHIVNHKTYHRGYIADMLYESGLKPPTIDLPVFLRDVWQSAATAKP